MECEVCAHKYGDTVTFLLVIGAMKGMQIQSVRSGE